MVTTDITMPSTEKIDTAVSIRATVFDIEKVIPGVITDTTILSKEKVDLVVILLKIEIKYL